MRKWCAVSVDGRNIASDQEGPFVAARVTFRCLRPPPPFYAMLFCSTSSVPARTKHCKSTLHRRGEGGKTKTQMFLSTRPCLSRVLFILQYFFLPLHWELILYGSHSKHGPIGRRPVGRRPSVSFLLIKTRENRRPVQITWFFVGTVRDRVGTVWFFVGTCRDCLKGF